MKIVEAATQVCQASVSQAAQQVSPSWDSIAVSLTSQSNAIAWGGVVIAFGSVLLAVIIAVAGIAWGQIIKAQALEKVDAEVSKQVEAKVNQWIEENGQALIGRKVSEFEEILPQKNDLTISDVVDIVAAEGKEDENEKK